MAHQDWGTDTPEQREQRLSTFDSALQSCHRRVERLLVRNERLRQALIDAGVAPVLVKKIERGSVA